MNAHTDMHGIHVHYTHTHTHTHNENDISIDCLAKNKIQHLNPIKKVMMVYNLFRHSCNRNYICRTPIKANDNDISFQTILISFFATRSFSKW